MGTLKVSLRNDFIDRFRIPIKDLNGVIDRLKMEGFAIFQTKFDHVVFDEEKVGKRVLMMNFK